MVEEPLSKSSKKKIFQKPLNTVWFDLDQIDSKNHFLKTKKYYHGVKFELYDLLMVSQMISKNYCRRKSGLNIDEKGFDEEMEKQNKKKNHRQKCMTG